MFWQLGIAVNAKRQSIKVQLNIYATFLEFVDKIDRVYSRSTSFHVNILDQFKH